MPTAISPLGFLSGGGEMGARMRALDWSRSPLGVPVCWPQTLKTAVSICLGSRHPIVIWWGKEHLTQFYNDAYISFLGGSKHPNALGQSARECWREIWHIIEPMLEGVFATGNATWSEDFLYVIERNLPREEGYFTFTYGPLRATDGGTVEGIFCPCTETTEKTVGARRLETLRKLGGQSLEAATVASACERAAQSLAENPHDIPFAAIYQVENEIELRASVGIAASDMQSWPLREVVRARCAGEVDLTARALQVRGRVWPEPVRNAMIIPLLSSAHDRVVGLSVLGVSPRRPLDSAYRAFLDLVAGQICSVMTSARAYEDERNRADALARLDRAKTVFFSNISHEFRTPLTLLLGPLEEALASAELPARLAQQLKLARGSALRLSKLVNSLLEFSRIEAGRARVSFEPTDLAALTRNLASTFRSAIESAGLTFKVECADFAEPVYVGRQMWEKIVLNLLSNAFKFTLHGSIVVRLRNDAGHAVFEVTDTGVGIPEGQIPHLFDRFHQVEGIVGRSQEGSGIGLALVKDLVKLHGASLEVSSRVGEGTTFRVLIPLGIRHLPSERIVPAQTTHALSAGSEAFVQEALSWIPYATESPARLASLSEASISVADRGSADAPSARILLADDNADMRAYVHGLLSPAYTVESVVDGEQALIAAHRQRPDLVLSDIMMPRLDGLALLKALRADDDLRDVPVILLSARAGEEARIEGLDAGVDDYLVKPFTSRELLARLGASLKLARQRREFNERLARDLDAIRRLYEVGNLCARSDSQLATCLRELLEAAIAIMTADSGNIQLLDYDSGTLEVAAHSGLEQPVSGSFAQVKTGEAPVCDAAMQRAHRVIIEDVTRSELLARQAARDVLVTAGIRAMQATPLLSSTGQVLGMISTHFSQPYRPDERGLRFLDLLARQAADYLERKRAEKSLQSSQEQLRQSDRLKDEFLAMLAHELRNPLAPISNAIEILARLFPRDSRAQSVMDMIKRQVKQLTRLVDDLLDVSRITQGRIQLQRRPIDLSSVIAQAAETIEPQLREKRHRISIATSSSVPLYVNGDFARLVQCIGNILSNAVKYTDPGGEISVRTRVEHMSVVIEISDTGVGIAPELLPRVFDLFVQSDRTLDRAQGGLGIGLAVVKRLVQMHDGEIRARSAGVGHGSTFEIRLPRIARPEVPLAVASQLQVASRRVLIVDDNVDAANSLAMLLSAEGHETEVAYRAKDALDRAQAFKPEVVLLDIGLPEMDGYEVARRLRARSDLSGVRLVALTGYGQAEDRQRGQEAGFEDYLVKPVDLSALARTLAGMPAVRA
jgi:signal transduction histidine kinase/DNA-binding response OmpR family regulator